MPDLGKYADAVLSAYAVSIILIAAIVIISWRRAARAKMLLEAAEARRDG